MTPINEVQRAAIALSNTKKSPVDWNNDELIAKAEQFVKLVGFSGEEIITMAKRKADMHPVYGTDGILNWLDKRIIDENRKASRVMCHA